MALQKINPTRSSKVANQTAKKILIYGTDGEPSLTSREDFVNENSVTTELYKTLNITATGGKIKKIDGLAFVDDSSNISQNFKLLDSSEIPNSTAITVECWVTFIEGATGSTSYGFKIIGHFVKNAGGTLSQVGTTTTLHTSDGITGSPTFTFSVSAGNLSCVAASGGSVGGRSLIETKLIAISNNNFS